MALTLQERINLVKGVDLAQIGTTPVQPSEKIDASLKRIAGEIVMGTLLKASLPNVATFNPSDAQIKEWCMRVLDGAGMPARMSAAVISHAQWDTDGAAIADAAIRNTCLNCIAAFAAKI